MCLYTFFFLNFPINSFLNSHISFSPGQKLYGTIQSLLQNSRKDGSDRGAKVQRFGQVRLAPCQFVRRQAEALGWSLDPFVAGLSSLSAWPLHGGWQLHKVPLRTKYIICPSEKALTSRLSCSYGCLMPPRSNNWQLNLYFKTQAFPDFLFYQSQFNYTYSLPFIFWNNSLIPGGIMKPSKQNSD